LGSLVILHEKSPQQLISVRVENEQVMARSCHVISTIQESYSLFMKGSSSMFETPEDLLNTFLGYSYLRKLGFIVHRHDVDRLPCENDSKKRKVDKKQSEKNVVKQKKKPKERRVKQSSADSMTLRPQTDECRGWWISEPIDDVMEQCDDTDSLAPNNLFLGCDFLQDHSVMPLITDLHLNDAQMVEMEKIFHTLNIINDSHHTFKTNASFTSAKKDMIFDVWKAGSETNEPPSMILIISSFSKSTIPPIDKIFFLSQQFGSIPIFNCVVGDTGSIMFMNLCPFEIDNISFRKPLERPDQKPIDSLPSFSSTEQLL